MSFTDLFFMAILMVRELIIDYPHVSAAIILTVVLIWGLALKNHIDPHNWKRVRKQALVITLIAGAAAFFLLPMFFHSGLGHLNYLTDWLFHIASVASIMVYVWLITVPALLLFCSYGKK
ncbi:MAG: hypothetical protein IKZ88_08345 [Neisseriaceae bacterium]|nr:hypothetical protein [Neisseriaceae bacterium]